MVFLKRLLLCFFLFSFFLYGCGNNNKKTNPKLLSYEVLDEGVTITGLKDNNLAKVIIPDVIEGKTVTRIGQNAFASALFLDSITLPDSVEIIDDEAFINTKIKEFNCPRNLKKIGMRAFADVSTLFKINLNEGLEEIGEGFIARTNVKSLIIPSTVTSLGNNCLSVQGLHTIEFLGDVPKANRLNIGYYESAIIVNDEFYENYKSDKAFSKLDACIFKKSEIIDDFVIRENVLVRYVGSSTLVIIPSEVTVIANSAFRSALGMTQINLGPNVREIGEYAFSLTSLENIDLRNVTKIGEYAFSVTPDLEKVYIPQTVQEIGENAFTATKANLYFEASFFEGFDDFENQVIFNCPRGDYFEK